jgi:hypothetical protein
MFKISDQKCHPSDYPRYNWRLDFVSPYAKSPRVFKRIGNALLITALIAAIGGHWAVLQTVAWTTMLADNLRDCSLTQAVEKTFDGKHPCALCKQISAGKKSEKKTEFQIELKKFEFTHAASRFLFSAPSSFCTLSENSKSHLNFTSAPPVPPPRSILPG